MIKAENLGKRYKIRKTKKRRLLQEVILEQASETIDTIKSMGKSRSESSSSVQDIWALKDVSFSIEAGESVGIIGSNGAGKSTLLKVLARITSPSTGKVRLKGKVGSLLEVGTGFHAELTGRENVYLNGAILGMKRREIESKFDEIVAFSEIEDYLDTPVKRYSSGMRMRLAFSVAAHLDPEILLIDEVLAVGDVAFQRKSINKMSNIVSEGRTVLFVSHNLAAVRGLCQSAIYIRHGSIQSMGEVNTVVQEYLDANEERIGNSGENINRTSGSYREENRNTRILSATVLDSNKMPSTYLAHNKQVYVRLVLEITNPLSLTYVNMKLYNQDAEIILNSYDFEYNETWLEVRRPGRYIYDIQIPKNFLPPGKYYLGFEISRNYRGKKQSIRRRNFHQVDHVSPFEIFDNGSSLSKNHIPWRGAVHIPIQWKLISTELGD